MLVLLLLYCTRKVYINCGSLHVCSLLSRCVLQSILALGFHTHAAYQNEPHLLQLRGMLYLRQKELEDSPVSKSRGDTGVLIAGSLLFSASCAFQLSEVLRDVGLAALPSLTRWPWCAPVLHKTVYTHSGYCRPL